MEEKMPRKTIARKNRSARKHNVNMQNLLANILCEHRDEIPEHVFDKLIDVYNS